MDIDYPPDFFSGERLYWELWNSSGSDIISLSIDFDGGVPLESELVDVNSLLETTTLSYARRFVLFKENEEVPDALFSPYWRAVLEDGRVLTNPETGW